MTDNNELNLNELEEVAGGTGKNERAGGSKYPLPEDEYWMNYKIGEKDTMIRIANKFNTTVDKLMEKNSKWIPNKSLIRTGYYMLVPRTIK